MRHTRKSRKPNSRTKKTMVERHFASRCIQRLGYIPDFNSLVTKIQNQELQLYDRQSNRVTRWKWIDPVHGISCILPYDGIRKQLITILFEDLEILKKKVGTDGTENQLCSSACSNIEAKEENRETSAGE